MNDFEELINEVRVIDQIITWPNSETISNSFDERLNALTLHLYEKYNRTSSIPKTTEPTVRFFDIKPYYTDFIESRFWILNSKVHHERKDVIVAFKDGVNIQVRHGEYIHGGILDVASKENKHLVYIRYATKIDVDRKNFYIYFQGKELLNNHHRASIRFYLNLRPDKEEILKLAHYITEYFNVRKIPFQFKLPLDSNNYQRTDTLVLYMAQSHYEIGCELLRNVQITFENILENNLPLFVKKLYSGIGFAEDPIPHDSFGFSRCRLIAQFILDSKNSYTSTVEIKNDVIERLKKAGYNIDEFYRNPNTCFDYASKIIVENNLPHVKGINVWIPRKKQKKYYEIAETIALELIERAVYSESNGFTWISYDEKNNEKYYRFLNQAETFNILIFLFEFLYFKKFRNKIINTVYYKLICKTLNNTKFDSIRKIMLDNDNKSVVPEGISIGSNTLIRLLDTVSHMKTNKAGDSWEEIRSEVFNKTLRNKLTNKQTLLKAEEYYNTYYGEGKPVPNAYGNYEYCPGKEGRLDLGKIMLYAARPSLRNRNTQKYLERFLRQHCH